MLDLSCVPYRTEVVPRELVEACKIKRTTQVEIQCGRPNTMELFSFELQSAFE